MSLQLFADIVELVLFVTPVLYLARFQVLSVYTTVVTAIRARRQRQVERWRQRHLDIAVSGSGALGRGGGGQLGGVEMKARGVSDRDRHNMTVIADVLDEVSRKAAMDAEATLRKAGMRGQG